MTSKKNEQLNTQKKLEGVAIAKLLSGDLTHYIDLWNEAFVSDPYAFRTSITKWKEKPEIEIEKEFYASIRNKNFVLGAFFENQLIGMVGIFHHKSDYTLWGTFVRSAFRGKNIGQELITAAIKKLHLSNPEVRDLYLEVRSGAKTARALYAKLGFREMRNKPTGEIIAVKRLR